MENQGPLYRILAIIMVVTLIPWTAGWLPGTSAFGFPWSAFVMLLAGPLLLVPLAGGSDRITDDEQNNPEP